MKSVCKGSENIINMQNLHENLEVQRQGTGNKVMIRTSSSEADGFLRENESQQLGIKCIWAVSGKDP